ncbi:MAG: hypothetical protein GX564_07675 [Oligosphaeraceae bacterium]|nr:hypothetical protein [Oligosphaeraceae bacterium]
MAKFIRSFFSNPILQREFVMASRNSKTILGAAGTASVLGLILYLLWPRSGIFSDANSNELFTIFLGTELTFMILLTAGFTASAITSERERRTFVMLQTCLLSPGEILTGKLVGTLGISLVLFLTSIPITALCALSGGISIATLCQALCIVGASTLVYGLLGLAVSSLCQRSYTALLATYIGITVLAGATWLPSTLVVFSGLQPLFLKLRALSPYEALFALQFAEQYEVGVIGASADQVFTIFITSMLCLVGLFFAVFARFIFAPPNLRRSMTVSKYTDSKTMLKRTLGFPFYLIDPLRRKKNISLRRNPVFVAEIRSKIFGNPKFIIRALSLCICLSIGILALIAQQVGETDLDKIRAVAIIFQLGVVALLAPTVSSGSITDERISDTLLLLRLSPLSSVKVVTGKMKAALLYVLIFLLSSLPVFLALVYLESTSGPNFAAIIPAGLDSESLQAAGAALKEFCNTYWRVGAWVGVLITTCLALTAGSLCSSCFSPSTGVATAVSYCFALLFTAGSLSILLFSTRISPSIQAAFLMFNPFVAALEITLDNSMAAKLPSLFGNRLWQNHLLIFSGLTVILLAISAWRVHFLFKEQK